MHTTYAFLASLLVAQVVDGRRKAGSSQEQELSSSHYKSQSPIEGQAALDAFKATPQVGALFGPLIDGIQQAELLNTATASFDPTLPKPILKVSTASGNTIFGEIASTSRVPVAWKVEGNFTLEIDNTGTDTVVYVSGLGTYPAAQGLALYETAMQEAGIDPTACDGTDMGCIEEEMAAAGKFLLKKSYMKYVNYKRISSAPGKLSKVLVSAFGSMKIFAAVHAKGEWPKIFYSMITAVPLKLTSFTFEGERVQATSEEDLDADARFGSYHLVAKSNMMGEKSMKDAKSTMSLAESFAASGMAFAKMLAFGNEKIRAEMQKVGLDEAASLKALRNLFSLCQLNLDPGHGPTGDPQCGGKCDAPKCQGRIWWGTSPGVSFSDVTV